VIPGAQSAFDAENEGYREGKFGYLDVLDAQRTLFDVKGQYIEALKGYHKAVATVERLICESLDLIQSNVQQK
jgi:cobalt-zinc-cadmium efflux system outer membrane protein